MPRPDATPLEARDSDHDRILLPLLAARYFAMPHLVWVGLAAYLLAIGDGLDDGDTLQPVRLASGTLLAHSP